MPCLTAHVSTLRPPNRGVVRSCLDLSARVAEEPTGLRFIAFLTGRRQDDNGYSLAVGRLLQVLQQLKAIYGGHVHDARRLLSKLILNWVQIISLAEQTEHVW